MRKLFSPTSPSLPICRLVYFHSFNYLIILHTRSQALNFRFNIFARAPVLSRFHIFSALFRPSSRATLLNGSMYSPGELSATLLAASCLTPAPTSSASRWLSQHLRLGLDSRWQLTSLPPPSLPLSTWCDPFLLACSHPTFPSAQPIRISQRYMSYGAARSPHPIIRLWIPSSKISPPSICFRLQYIKHGFPTLILGTNAPMPSGQLSVSKAWNIGCSACHAVIAHAYQRPMLPHMVPVLMSHPDRST